jgi:hypothetical protein
MCVHACLKATPVSPIVREVAETVYAYRFTVGAAVGLVVGFAVSAEPAAGSAGARIYS